MTKDEFVHSVNTLRKNNKNKWYNWQGIVNGVDIRLKGYNTWIQRIEVTTSIDSNYPDCTVKQFKSFLMNII